MVESRHWTAGIKLFSFSHGHTHPDDGLEHYVAEVGAGVEVFDLEASPAHDLADDSVWAGFMERVRADEFFGAGGGAPCSSFSAGRSAYDGGLPPLRRECPPDLFGLAGPTPEEKETVRLCTLLAHRKAELFEIAYGKGMPFWGETQQWWQGHPSVVKLRRFVAIAKPEGVEITGMVQCADGARRTNATDLTHYLM